jgi:hypothetical protein
VSDTSELRAIVQKVIAGGKHGPYAVALSDDPAPRNITFALTPSVWGNNPAPEPGTVVMLSGLVRKRAGWRATGSRHVTLADEQPARSTE